VEPVWLSDREIVEDKTNNINSHRCDWIATNVAGTDEKIHNFVERKKFWRWNVLGWWPTIHLVMDTLISSKKYRYRVELRLWHSLITSINPLRTITKRINGPTDRWQTWPAVIWCLILWSYTMIRICWGESEKL
jgi:hypothetical protein